MIDMDEYGRQARIAEAAESVWLNRLADEAEAEGSDGSISIEELAAEIRARRD
ncbi:hypothetical protein [Streptomyces sp. NPDC058045]|uniref:hypothetical protein n=1 Tax=Streptomyces sp. NPDC058045 TaxID=3346311 RepID=UPI0036EA9D5B